MWRFSLSRHPMAVAILNSPDSRPSMIDTQRIAAIVFDLDGTLMQLKGGQKGGALAKALRPVAPLLPNRDPVAAAKRFFVITETPVNYLLAVMDRMGLMTLLTPLVDRARHAKGIGTLGNLFPVSGVTDMLPRLSQRYKLGILTNRARREAHGFVDQNAYHSLFGTVTTRQDTWYFKPHPQALRITAQRLGIPAEQVLMVGDMPVDMQTARRAGAQALGVLTGFATEAELREAGANEVVGSVAELERVLGIA
jgi:phosphoglycolate phosphatase-like HAD superfamily hydrolase